MNKLLLVSVLAGAFASAVSAAPIAFDFKDPKGVNNVQFHLDAPLESIAGTANGISGTVTFDPAAPETTSGKITVAADTLVVPNSMMLGHLQGKGWVDTKNHPEITFELIKLTNLKTAAGVTTADATGKFTLKGVTQEITVPVKLTYLADALEKRMPGKKGDLLVIRSDFTIRRGDYGIKPGENEDKVSSEIKITLAIAGSAPKA